MHPQVKLIGELIDGTLRAVTVNEDGSIRTTGRDSTDDSISTSDASAANQLTEIEQLIKIRDRLPASGTAQSVSVSNLPATQPISATDLPLPSGAASATNQSTMTERLVEVRDRLPTTVGAKTAALSFPVTLSTDGAFSVSFGATADTAATTDTGAFSFLQFIKRLLSIKLPSALVSDRFKVESLLSSTARVTSLINTTTTGTIAAGASSVAIANIGEAAGTVKGVSLPAKTTIFWAANGNDVLDAVNYSGVGTTLLITTVT